MFVVCVFEGEVFVGGRNVVVRATWTVNIGLDSSVVEHMTSDAGVLSSIHFKYRLSLFIIYSGDAHFQKKLL